MTSTSRSFRRSQVIPSFGLAVVLLGALTMIRLIGLKFSVVDLFFDEAQYWAWSREPAFGYFTKPPLLAWIIATAEPLCGSSEACVRAPAPILYFGTCLLVFAVAIGLGMLAKYAMVYFLLGAALAACLDRDARLLLRRRDVWLGLALAAL